MQTLLFLACVVAAATAQSCSYEDFCANHTMCKYPGINTRNCRTVKYRGVTSTDKQAVVNIHNKLRSKIALGKETAGSPGPQPAASNMKKLVWDDVLATVAQRWADQCTFKLDNCGQDARFKFGQNNYLEHILGSAETGENWSTAIKEWYNEVRDFNRNDISPFENDEKTGHYTQLVWAETQYVGCGFIVYKKKGGLYKKLYVCKYGPSGNIIDADTTMYKTGKACSACSGICETSTGLCL